MSAFTAISELLAGTTGLDAASIGPTTLERAVREGMIRTALPDTLSYQALLHTRPAELQELIETIVVPETWFLRDREAFNALARLAGSWPKDGRQRRLLSLPCSTGEEPYSIAMTLLECGLGPENFHIEAIDISARALLAAQRGLYGRNSFRGADLEFRERHFDKSGRGYRLCERVRQCVSFRCGNLFTAGLLSEHVYEVIFCRNVLIYFNVAGQGRAIRVLQSALRPDGVLFVGPSESALLLAREMIPLSVPQAFAFTNGAPESLDASWTRTRRIRGGGSRSASTSTVARPRAPARRDAPPRQPTVTPVAAQPPSPETTLAVIGDLADRGQLAQAAALCNTYLATHEPSAPALYLVGLIRDASGAYDEAVTNYRMALYLDPNHAEALAHLALLLEKQGDVAAARQARERGRRRTRREIK